MDAVVPDVAVKAAELQTHCQNLEVSNTRMRLDGIIATVAQVKLPAQLRDEETEKG